MRLYLKPAELSAVVQDPDKALLTAVTLSCSAASCSSCCSCVRPSWQGSASPKPVCSQPLPDRVSEAPCWQTARFDHCLSPFLLPRHTKPCFTGLPAALCSRGPDEAALQACSGHLAANWCSGEWVYMLGTWMLMARVPSKNLQVPNSSPSPYYKQDVFPSLFP